MYALGGSIVTVYLLILYCLLYREERNLGNDDAVEERPLVTVEEQTPLLSNNAPPNKALSPESALRQRATMDGWDMV
jgi:hypothetical protein